jgi:cyanophycinase
VPLASGSLLLMLLVAGGSAAQGGAPVPTTACPDAPALPATLPPPPADGQRSEGPQKGSLLIIGGGTNPPEIRNAGIELAGGKAAKWVNIPTAGTDQEIADAMKNGAGLFIRGLHVTFLNAKDRAEADSEAFVAPLKTANAVAFDGGRQWRLVDVYAGTLTEREIKAVLDRGGLIAGSSAGATIQGSFLVRGSPKNNLILISPDHEVGFGFISNVAIDQHVVVRHRECDLARLIAKQPGLLGIGIDESTAVIVRKNLMTVIGLGSVLITDGAEHGSLPFYALKPGDRFDLATWSKLAAGH